MKKEFLVSSLLLIVIACSMSCDESLPPYLDPRNVFQATVRAQYILAINDNSVLVFFVARNSYEETFQGPGVLSGTLKLTSRRDVTVQKTFELTAANLTHSTNYNSGNGILTVDPKDSVVFLARWNLTDDGGRDLREFFFSYRTDPTCTLRQIAREEIFVMQGSVKLYDKIETVSSRPTEFSLCHVTAWLDVRTCPSIIPEKACSYLPQ